MARTTSSDLAEEIYEGTKAIMKLLSEFINCTLFPEWMGSYHVPWTKIRSRSCWTHILWALQTMNMPTHVISWRTTFWRRWNALRWVTSWPDSADKVSLRLAGRYFPVAQELLSSADSTPIPQTCPSICGIYQLVLNQPLIYPISYRIHQFTLNWRNSYFSTRVIILYP